MIRVRRSELANGIRVVSTAMPEAWAASLGVWVEQGSVHDPEGRSGASYALMRLLAETMEWGTAADVAERIKGASGTLNAFTAKEYTCFYNTVPAEQASFGQDALAAVFSESNFRVDELERILDLATQDVLRGEDTPDDYVHEVFAKTIWSDHPLGRPIGGTIDSLRCIDARCLRDVFASGYRRGRVVVSAAGRVDHESICEWADRHLGQLAASSGVPPLRPPTPHADVVVVPQPLGQVHLCVGLPTSPLAGPDRFALTLLNARLGAVASSRLYREVRSRLGWVSTIYSFLSWYASAGYWGVYAATSAERAGSVIGAAVQEFDRLATHGLPTPELMRAKRMVKGQQVLAAERPEEHMARAARNELAFRRHLPREEIDDSIDRVGRDEIVDLTRRLLREGEMTLVALGDLEGRTIDRRLLVPSRSRRR